MGDMILGRHIVAALCLNGQFYGFGAVHKNAQLRQYQYCERTLHQNHRSGLGSFLPLAAANTKLRAGSITSRRATTVRNFATPSSCAFQLIEGAIMIESIKPCLFFATTSASGPRPHLWHQRGHLHLPQYPTSYQPIAHPIQRRPPIVIATLCGFDLLGVRSEHHWTCSNFHVAPLSAD